MTASAFCLLSSVFCLLSSDSRTQNGGRITTEHAAHFIQMRHKLLCFAIAEILSQDKVIPALFQRTLGNIQEPGFISFTSPPKSFGDIGRNGNRSTAHLGH